MRNRGCYVDEYVNFNHGWIYGRITQELRKLFPKVFEYLDAEDSKQAQAVGSSQERKPLWRLLNKTGQSLVTVDIAFPTGVDLAKHKGREKASITESHLWFGMFMKLES